MHRRLRSKMVFAANAFVMMSIFLSIVAFAAESAPPAEIEIVTKTDAPIKKISVTPNGHIFVSIPGASEPSLRLSQINQDKFYPTPAYWQLGNVRALTNDVQNQMWFLFTKENSSPYSAALFAYDVAKQHVVFKMDLVSPSLSQSNNLDMVVDNKGHIAYIADLANPSPALVVIDLKTKTLRRVLEGHLPKAGPGSLALEQSGSWLYYAANNDKYIYRVRTSDLQKPLPGVAQSKPHIERVGEKPPSNAIAIDKAGRVYVAEQNANAVGVLRPRETYVRLVEGKALRGRANDLSFTPEGYLYVTVNAEQKDATQAVKSLSYVLRFKPSCGCEATLPPGGLLGPPANF